MIDEAASQDDLSEMLRQRVDGVPLEHILGWAEFCGVRIVVQPGVFVPRKRIEFLVRRAASMVAPRDLDPAAVRCARANVEPVSGRVFEGDLFDALPRELMGRVSLLIVNAPYVPSNEIAHMPPEADSSGTASGTNSLSVDDLAGLSGVSRRAISTWETGRAQPTPGPLLRVAAALQTTVPDLVLIPRGEVTINDLRVRVGLTQGKAANGLGISATLLLDIGRVRKPLNDSRVDAFAELCRVPVEDVRSAWLRAIDTRDARLKSL